MQVLDVFTIQVSILIVRKAHLAPMVIIDRLIYFTLHVALREALSSGGGEQTRALLRHCSLKHMKLDYHYYNIIT